MEKSILVGNGYNIQFGGKTSNGEYVYGNSMILKRVEENARNDKYLEIIPGVTPHAFGSIFQMLFERYEQMIVGIDALKFADTPEEMKAIIDLSKRHLKGNNRFCGVGMEDYFLIMRNSNRKLASQVGGTPVKDSTLLQGLLLLFLDAIFNEGDIETIYKKSPHFSNELEKYDNVFTVNYDNNLDKLTTKKVYHLHGDFHTLDDSYRPETITGFRAQHQIDPPKYIPSRSHMFCNAIMSYSGAKKLDLMETKKGINKFAQFFSKYPSKAKEFDAQVRQPEQKEFLDIMINHPELRDTEYPLDEFRNITGELDILGLSPNNDSHIFAMINGNEHLNRVIYYSKSIDDSKKASDVIKLPLEIKDVNEYWESM